MFLLIYAEKVVFSQRHLAVVRIKTRMQQHSRFKIQEHIIHHQVMGHIDQHNLISDKQDSTDHGQTEKSAGKSIKIIVYTTRRKQVEKNPTGSYSGKLDAPWTARSEGRTGSIYRTSFVDHWKKIIQNGTRKSDSLKQPV